jgi:hypothetical protein
MRSVAASDCTTQMSVAHTVSHTMAHTVPHTMTHTLTHTRKPKRQRVIPYVFSSDRLHELLWRLMDDGDPMLRAYVYRMNATDKLFPALFVGAPFRGLIKWLRDEHGGGNFHIIIRRSKSMELSGIICIGVPLGFRTC